MVCTKVLLTRSPLSDRSRTARLACLIHAASVHPELGSNSQNLPTSMNSLSEVRVAANFRAPQYAGQQKMLPHHWRGPQNRNRSAFAYGSSSRAFLGQLKKFWFNNFKIFKVLSRLADTKLIHPPLPTLFIK
jgi:hypothetical protein